MLIDTTFQCWRDSELTTHSMANLFNLLSPVGRSAHSGILFLGLQMAWPTIHLSTTEPVIPTENNPTRGQFQVHSWIMRCKQKESIVCGEANCIILGKV